VAAVAVVIVVIVLLILINGHNPKPPSSAGSTPLATPTLRSSSPAVSPTPTSKPKPKHPKRHPGGGVTTPTARPSHRPTRAAVPPNTAMAEVSVLNNSRVHGLAHQVAAEVGDRGWQIAQVGNLQGIVPATTVYYAPGDEQAAQHLAGQFGQIQRIEPDSEGRIHLGGLTLVVTRYWTG
jgi:hypothetical protein